MPAASSLLQRWIERGTSRRVGSRGLGSLSAPPEKITDGGYRGVCRKEVTYKYLQAIATGCRCLEPPPKEDLQAIATGGARP